MAHEIEGRQGEFLIVDENGAQSETLTPENADKEANRMLIDANGFHKLSLIWRARGEQSLEPDRPPAERRIGAVAVRMAFVKTIGWPTPVEMPIVEGVWQQCEEYLLRMDCRPGAESGAGKPQI